MSKKGGTKSWSRNAFSRRRVYMGMGSVAKHAIVDTMVIIWLHLPCTSLVLTLAHKAAVPIENGSSSRQKHWSSWSSTLAVPCRPCMCTSGKRATTSLRVCILFVDNLYMASCAHEQKAHGLWSISGYCGSYHNDFTIVTPSGVTFSQVFRYCVFTVEPP